MERVVGHFWVNDAGSKLTLYEADYFIHILREGVLAYAMVPHSERLCTCPERECHQRRLAAIQN